MRGDSNEVICILLSDIHLSLSPPVWRTAEPNWLEAMKRPLREVKEMQSEYGCPVICAGDIFNRWNSSPELINFALRNLPDMYAIPGQHDLPLHRYEDLYRSAYWTLVHAGKIQSLPLDCCVVLGNIVLRGFPFGFKIETCSKRFDGRIHIAVVHDYVWIPGKSYLDAPSENKLKRTRRELTTYDVIQYGDNHKGFTIRSQGKPVIFNCGTFMRRASDEKDYKPQVGLLLSSGDVETHYLNISKDKSIKTLSDKVVEEEFDMKTFIEELEKLGDTSLDFVEAMKRYLEKNKKKVNEETKKILLKAMGL